MADIQIPIGDEVINLPEWATETTLASLASVMGSNDQARNILIKALDSTGGDIDKVRKSLGDLKQVEEKTSYERAQSISSVIKGVTSKAVGMLQGLSNTKEPLTKMVGMAKTFKDTLGDMSDKSGAGAKTMEAMGEKFAPVFKSLGKIGNVAADVGLAYAGFLAAKVEQFAQSQASMIDSGAIFMDTADRFQEIRELSYQGGVSYQAMTQTISKYGKGIQVLGDGVSMGSVSFATMFQQLNRANNAFGDFGQTNTEMLETFGQYTDVMRLTGQIDRNTANVGDKLTNGYQQLMLENSALATATAFNRKALISSTMAGLSDIDFAAPNQRIREKIGAQTADNLMALQTTFTALAQNDPSQGGLGNELGSMLLDQLKKAQMNFERGGQFTLIRDNGPLLTAFQNLEGGTEFLKNLERDIIDPNVNITRTEILRRFAQLKSRDGQGTMVSGEMNSMVYKLSNAVDMMRNSNSKLANMSDEEVGNMQSKAATALEAQGAVTEAINDAAGVLLRAQDMLMPNMVSLSDTIKSIVDGYSGTDAAPETETEKRIASKEMAEAQLNATNDLNKVRDAITGKGPAPPMKGFAGGDVQWTKMFGKTHNADGSLKIPTQRFIGGYLGSNQLATVGEQGAEMLITDMPTYVKTINQIARNLGDAINVTKNESGQTTYDYKDGYKMVSDGGGDNLFDKAGKLLYNELSIAGLTRRTYSEGDIAEMFVGSAGGSTVTRHMFNGKPIGTEVSAGNITVAQAGDGGSGGLMATSYNMGQGLTMQAESNMVTGEAAVTADMSDAGLDRMDPRSAQHQLDAAKSMLKSDGVKEGLKSTPKVAAMFREAMKNMTIHQRKSRVRQSFEYE